eukprot:363275-Chlamydomonas_euryale.AAC.9
MKAWLPCLHAGHNLPHGVNAYAKQGAEDSWKMLKDFTVKEFRGMSSSFVSSREKRDELRSAVLPADARRCPSVSWRIRTVLLSSAQAIYTSPNPSRGWIPDSSDPDVLLGVVSSDVRLAVRACRDWCSALNLEYVSPEIRVRQTSTTCC